MIRNDLPQTAATDASLASATGTEPQLRRRFVLEALESLSGRATVDELVDALLTRGDDAVDDDAETIRIRLHHVDLPKLADAGLIAYHVDRNRVWLLD
ncbi:DUF7344 domain-containing protein [Haloterrigena alkaliphila]|uniref:DUF7344 domain-containing protein n=1 Tax=Haloterrigena alkaliphila TaxID=2816475 RepID=A0A8A2VDQ5_9EURY|nr:hypothetical protein [Haloterrigena alkaliphila]QSW98840.1 hypothetical protein J0X25_15830 [Haloterrigena alkaliphila]